MIGKNIKTRREEIGLTQQELANRVNVDRSMISKLEKNKTQPSISTLESLAYALKISISELMRKEKWDFYKQIPTVATGEYSENLTQLDFKPWIRKTARLWPGFSFAKIHNY